ncbi:MAG: glycosyltransferase family 4 protein [Candidatus Thorarchaeota archaeon]
MKILFISDYFQPYSVGASNISTFLVAKELSKKNKVFVMTQKFCDKPWNYDGLIVYPDLPKYSSGKNMSEIIITEIVNFFSMQHSFSFYRNINNFCIKHGIDIINVQSNNLTLLISLLFLKIPVVMDVRDYYFTCPFMLKTIKCDRYHLFCLPSNASKKANWLMKNLSIIFFRYQTVLYFIQKNIIFKPLFLIQSNKVFAANSKYVSDKLSEAFKNNKDKIRIIYNVINITDYKFSKKRKTNTILYASALEESKGIWDVIHAFELLDGNYQLIIVGDGPEESLIRKYIKKRRIKGIKMLGKLEYKLIPELYKKSYITIQPSRWPEPFGRYILEAFASRTPLVTTPTGGTKEAVKDKKTGILVNVGDAEGMSKAIKKLFNDKNLYTSIQNNIKKEALNYDPDKISKIRLTLYQSLLSKKK